jgi:UDP-MurNAc hydroxylase
MPKKKSEMKINKLDSISVKYVYSSCILTKTPDVTILHDPWFTEGVYDGSWYHFPLVDDPINSIGDCDLIYVSHVHPDHYDPIFIKRYFQRWGRKKIIIADHSPNHLANKIRADALDVEVMYAPTYIGGTKIEIFPHKSGSISDIDSAIVVKYKDHLGREHCIVNSNDIIFDKETAEKLKSIAGDIDILLCGYTGAGPYPQTYFDINDPELKIQALRKKNEFFDRYRRLIEVMQAKINIPFAGKYILGGRLAHLNYFRGVADPLEVTSFDKRALILDDNGGEIDTKSLLPSKLRTVAYAEIDLKNRIDEIKYEKMAYEKFIPESQIENLPLKRLISIAARHARAKSECTSDYYFCISLPGEESALINANKEQNEPVKFVQTGGVFPEPRSEIFIDPRYLFGLLTHVFHWNNAEVGSQYETRRYPNVLNRSAQTFLNYFCV